MPEWRRADGAAVPADDDCSPDDCSPDDCSPADSDAVRTPDTGFLVLEPDDSVMVTNPAARQWIDHLAPAGTGPPAALPAEIRAVVTRTRRLADGRPGAVVSARIHTREGALLVVRGSPVGAGRVAVLLEAGRPAEHAAAMADVYRFTERERTITALVARGLTTTEIADRLHLSPYTVQDHLKAIFDKSGTGSRGELVCRLFLEHHIERHDDPEAANCA